MIYLLFSMHLLPCAFFSVLSALFNLGIIFKALWLLFDILTVETQKRRGM